jgi:hypothetical protein
MRGGRLRRSAFERSSGVSSSLVAEVFASQIGGLGGEKR